MRKSVPLFIGIVIAAIFLFFTFGCNSDRSATESSGTLALFLSDATTDYQAVYVTISEVQVHASGNTEKDQGDSGWITVAEPAQTYNLLDLINGVMAELGVTELETGRYTMLRMILGETPDSKTNLLGYEHPYPNYLIDSSGEEIDLFVPSGYQTGIKLVSGFDITAGASTELVLDFDASRSVVKAGKSGKYLLKPTIKVIDTINRADLNGVVTDQEGNSIAGAFVSAQIYHEGSVDLGIESAVEVFTSTKTDADGSYMLYLPPGEYNIVAFKNTAEGETTTVLGPECRSLDAENNFTYNEDFTLAENNTGLLSVDLDLVPEQTVSISAWKQIECDGSDILVEVPTPLIIDVQVQSERHEMILPVGTYTIHVAVGETESRENNVDIAAGEQTILSFNFMGTEPEEDDMQ